MSLFAFILMLVAIGLTHWAWTIAWLIRKQPDPKAECSRRRLAYMLRKILS